MRLLARADTAEFLQWFGLLGAALAWTAQHVLAFGVTVADCSAGGSRWGISLDAWEIAITAVTGALVLVSEAAAVTILVETRGTDDDDPPPLGRRHFFAAAAALGNLLFLVIIVLGAIAVLYHPECRPA
jgi:hypothetical protein